MRTSIRGRSSRSFRPRADAGRTLSMTTKTVDDIRVVLGRRSRPALAAIVPASGDAPDASVFKSSDDIVGNVSCVAFRRLVVSQYPAIRRYQSGNEGSPRGWNLKTPSEAGSEEAGGGPLGDRPRLRGRRADGRLPARGSTDGHRSRPRR